MTAPLIQGASGIEGEKLTYASTNENNKEIYTFTANEPVTSVSYTHLTLPTKRIV